MLQVHTVILLEEESDKLLIACYFEGSNLEYYSYILLLHLLITSYKVSPAFQNASSLPTTTSVAKLTVRITHFISVFQPQRHTSL